MGNSEEFFKKVLESNQKYYIGFRDMVLEHRKKGRDYHVLGDYLAVRDDMLNELGVNNGAGIYNFLAENRFNHVFYDGLFERLRERVEKES